MIVDTLDNAHLYRDLSPRIALAFDYLLGTDLVRAAAGLYEIEGMAVHAIVQEYVTRPPGHGAWEAHRRHIDLQYLVSGVERMGYAQLARLTPGAYDPARDFQALSGEGEYLTLGPRDFMLLFPGDAHRPRMAAGEPAPVRKVVVKIAVAA